MCRSVSAQKPAVCHGGTPGGRGLWLRGFYGSGVDQHDGDVVLDGVDAAAFAAFQAVAVVENYRFLANGANKHLEKILRNHGAFIVAPTSLLTRHPQTEDAIESLFDRAEVQSEGRSEVECQREFLMASS